MEPAEVARAIDAAISIAVALDLDAQRATILQNSNKLALRLLPCDAFARVAPVAHEHAQFEIGIARLLAESQSPVAGLHPRVEPRGHRRDGFEVTLWSYCEPLAQEVSPPDYADALGRLHTGMRTVELPTPHFTDRVQEAQRLVASPALTPELADADRALLARTLSRLPDAIRARGLPEQVLHGEPHPGNVINTAGGPVFVDLETCCRGPVEFDLAHVPEAVSDHYPGLDPGTLRDCRQLVLAMVAAWRWERGDQLPNGLSFGFELLRVLRAGPPWPTIDVVFGQAGAR